MNPVFADLPVSIFEIMSLEAKNRGAINLGQGFPEIDGFADVRAAAGRALMEHSNQYAPMRGLPTLRQAVADFYARQQGLTLDPDTQILITSGATEAICASIFALVTPGDEVVVFEPMYDAYVPLIKRAGGVPRIVTLSPPHWRFSADDLAVVFNERTKLVLITTPNNPTTHCFDSEQLELLGDFCERYEAIVISDEVWEQVVFDRDHLSVLHIAKLARRSVKIGSAGKIFSLTGWKVGFVVAEKPLIDQVARAHQFITFATPPALQHAVAYGLGLPQTRFDEARAELQAQRDDLTRLLHRAGFVTLPTQGTYFLNIDLVASGIAGSGLDFAYDLVRNHGLATIPLQAFCETGRDLPVLRLCFAKAPESLTGGVEALTRAR